MKMKMNSKKDPAGGNHPAGQDRSICKSDTILLVSNDNERFPADPLAQSRKEVYDEHKALLRQAQSNPNLSPEKRLFYKKADKIARKLWRAGRGEKKLTAFEHLFFTKIRVYTIGMPPADMQAAIKALNSLMRSAICAMRVFDGDPHVANAAAAARFNEITRTQSRAANAKGHAAECTFLIAAAAQNRAGSCPPPTAENARKTTVTKKIGVSPMKNQLYHFSGKGIYFSTNYKNIFVPDGNGGVRAVLEERP